MIKMITPRKLALLTLVATLFTLAACSGGKVARISDVEPLPKDLPKDLMNKFEVAEVVAPTPSPSPSGSPSAAENALEKKNVKKKAAVKSKKSTAKEFVYPSRRPKVDPIWIGEKMTLEITYFGMAAGDFVTEVLPYKSIQNRKVYHLKASAKSSSVFSLFYRLDDWLESFMDYEGLFSHRFHLVQDESKQSRDALELFDSEKRQVYYWNRRNHVEKGYSETKDYVEMTPFPQDSFSTAYYLRTLPLEVGKVYSFPVVSEGKTWEAVLTVLRKEMMDTPLGKVETIVVRPQTKFQGVMQQKRGDSLIWLTNDDRRFIVRLEAQVKVGTVVARLKKVELGEKPE